MDSSPDVFPLLEVLKVAPKIQPVVTETDEEFTITKFAAK
jgi:hypothetical protein